MSFYDERADVLTVDELLEKIDNITVDDFLKKMNSGYRYDLFYMGEEVFQNMYVRDMIQIVETNNNMDYNLSLVETGDISEYTDTDGCVYKSIYIDGLGPVKTKYSNDIDLSDSTVFISRHKDEFNLIIINSIDEDVVYDNMIRQIITDMKIKTLNRLCRLIIDAIEIHKVYLENEYGIR